MAAWAGGQLIHAPLQQLQQGLRQMTKFNSLRMIAEVGPTVGYAAFAVAGVLTVTTGTVSIATSMFIALVAGGMLPRRSARSPMLDRDRSKGSKQPEAAERRRFWNYSGRSWLSILAGRSNATVDLLLLTLLAVPAESIGFYAVAATSTGVVRGSGGITRPRPLPADRRDWSRRRRASPSSESSSASMRRSRLRPLRPFS